MPRRLLTLVSGLSLGAASSLGAQSILDLSARLAPQFHSYKVDAPSNLTISEFSVPMYLLLPITSNLSFDVGSSYTNARVEQTGTTNAVSTISGLTDTQIRGNLVLGNDFFVITGGVNLPTGKSTVSVDQRTAAGLIGSDFLAFPITNMGTGLGGTGGLAMALPLGDDWNFGLGMSVRHSAQYDPFDLQGAQVLHYQPGNEYRGRVGLDHPVGTGRFSLGLTYSTFGDDNLGGSIYNTGNRYLGQLDYNDSFGPGRVSLSGWNLFRTRGTLADSSIIDKEDIASGTIAYGVPLGGVIVEPNVEGRTWYQPGSSTSYLGTFGVRMQFSMGGLTVMPSGGFSVGVLAAAQAGTVGNQTASLTGFHGMLMIRVR
ncbi:MAG: hypothetical protein ACREPM_16195 [Gemmatimonadaceae bacterium]